MSKTINEYSPWLCDTNTVAQYLKIQEKIATIPAIDLRNMTLEHHASNLKSMVSEEGDEEDEGFGEYGYLLDLVDNVAVVKISGPLVAQNHFLNRFFGVVSYEEIRGALMAAVHHAAVDGIMLYIDTPGGEASGISDVSDLMIKIDQQVKPVYSYTPTRMLSGGYWLGAGGREIYTGKVASVGSIGVISVHMSILNMLKEVGYEPTVIRIGEFKALGTPYEKLDDKAKGVMEAQMRSIYDIFLSVVSESRGIGTSTLVSTAAEGRVFIGQDAVDIGLADEVLLYDDAVGQVSEKVKRSVSVTTPKLILPSRESGVDDMTKKRVLTQRAVDAMASGVPKEEVLADPKYFEEEESSSDKVEGEEGTEVSSDPKPKVEGEEGTEVSSDPKPKVEEEQGKESQNFDRLLDRITDLTSKVATLEAKNQSLETAMEASASLEDSMRKIVVEATNRMQVTLGGVVDKMEGLSAELVVRQHHKVLSLFNSRIKVGAQAEVPQEEDKPSRKPGAAADRGKKLTL